jgi:hypothetical protein
MVDPTGFLVGFQQAIGQLRQRLLHAKDYPEGIKQRQAAARWRLVEATGSIRGSTEVFAGKAPMGWRQPNTRATAS